MRYHCAVLEREHWYKLPCEKPAHMIYIDDDGVRHGYCASPEHTSIGARERARKGWVLDLPVVEAVA